MVRKLQPILGILQNFRSLFNPTKTIFQKFGFSNTETKTGNELWFQPKSKANFTFYSIGHLKALTPEIKIIYALTLSAMGGGVKLTHTFFEH